jgi:hypothetical protein
MLSNQHLLAYEPPTVVAIYERLIPCQNGGFLRDPVSTQTNLNLG